MLRLREDMVALRTSADHMEEKLKAEILFLKEQIQAEQCLKENLEDTLQLEIEGCKEEIGETLNDQLVFKSLISYRVCICFNCYLFKRSSVSAFCFSPFVIQTSWKV